ncbi:MAG TPA: glycosyltransferase family 2 protein [Planctomycetaceae bacterium]|nr:glycosyltransferase family 2 protein [Planctomycetaceae bacterium]
MKQPDRFRPTHARKGFAVVGGLELSSAQQDRGVDHGVSIVIPAYNEAACIGAVVSKAAEVARSLGCEFEIVVVDDASTDGTALVAGTAGARVLRHPYNRGYGNSLKTGITAAVHEFVIICDGDGSYPIEQMPRLLEDAAVFDMVIGARTGRHFHGSFFKRLARWWQLTLVSYVTGTTILDANSGFRFIRRSRALEYFDFVCSGFSFTTSITVALICEQSAVKFVGIDYHPRVGKSKVRYFRDTLRSLQILTHCILRYNPLKAFLLLAAVPMIAPAFVIVFARDSSTIVVSSTLCLCTSILTFAGGMIAYCMRARGSTSHIDAGVYAFVAQPPAVLECSDPSDVKEAA